MAEGDRRRNAPTTPIPISTLDDVRDMVSRTYASVNIIRKEILPPLADDTREARDTAREAIRSLSDHKDNTSVHGHDCTEQEHQKQQDNDIETLRIKVADTKTVAGSAMVHINNTNRILWWIIGVAGTVITAAIIFAISVRVTAVENSSDIQVNKSDIVENDQEIKLIRDSFMKEIRQLPSEVTRAAQMKRELNLDDVEEAVEHFEMTDYEKRAIQRIIERSRRRGVKDGN